MTSNGTDTSKDEFTNSTVDDAEADGSFATAPDAWRDVVETDQDADEPREIASDVEDEDSGLDESRHGDDECSLQEGLDTAAEDQDDTLPSLDQELLGEQDVSDSSLFQGPSPPVCSMWSHTLTHRAALLTDARAHRPGARPQEAVAHHLVSQYGDVRAPYNPLSAVLKLDNRQYPLSPLSVLPLLLFSPRIPDSPRHPVR